VCLGVLEVLRVLLVGSETLTVLFQTGDFVVEGVVARAEVVIMRFIDVGWLCLLVVTALDFVGSIERVDVFETTLVAGGEELIGVVIVARKVLLVGLLVVTMM